MVGLAVRGSAVAGPSKGTGEVAAAVCADARRPAVCPDPASWVPLSGHGLSARRASGGSSSRPCSKHRTPSSSAARAQDRSLLCGLHVHSQIDGHSGIDFRVDSTAVAHLAVGTSTDLKQLRGRVKSLLADHREWRLVFVERKRNWVADGLARRMLRGWREEARLRC